VSLRRRLLVAAFAAIGLASLYTLVPAAVADFGSLRARQEIERLRAGGKAPPLAAWTALRDDLQWAAGWSPGNPRWYDDLGYLYVLRARATGTLPELDALRRDLYREAAGHYRTAARLRPLFPYGWANLALAKHHAGEADAEMWHAFDRAMTYGRRETGVERMLAELAFGRWGELTPERAAAVRTMIAETRADMRQPMLDQAARQGIAIATAVRAAGTP
jgi:hypothetical protein